MIGRTLSHYEVLASPHHPRIAPDRERVGAPFHVLLSPDGRDLFLVLFRNEGDLWMASLDQEDRP